MTSGLRPPCSNGLMIFSGRRSFAAAQVPQENMVPTSKVVQIISFPWSKICQGRDGFALYGPTQGRLSWYITSTLPHSRKLK